MEYIMGHSPPRATSNEAYGDRDPLGEQINFLRFDGLDLSSVRPWNDQGA
jgi:hypothetical protein